MFKWEEVLKVALFTPGRNGWGLESMIVGGSGIGKSEIAKTLSEAMGLFTVEFSPGERGSGAFGVVPVVTEDQFLAFPPPIDAKELWSRKHAAFIVDEANLGCRLLKPHLQGLFGRKRLGSAFLGNGTRMLATINPTELSSGGFELDPPIANRLIWFYPDNLPVRPWLRWLDGFNGLESFAAGEPDSRDVAEAMALMAKTEEERVLDLWAPAFEGAKDSVREFISGRGHELLVKQPPAGDVKGAGPWPSGRSWEMVIRSLAGCAIHDVSMDTTSRFVSGSVGQGPGQEFETWLRFRDLPDPDRYLDGFEEFTMDAGRVDRSRAFVEAALHRVKDDGPGGKRMLRFFDLLTSIGTVAPDLIVGPMQELSNRKKLAYCPPALKDIIRPIVALRGKLRT